MNCNTHVLLFLDGKIYSIDTVLEFHLAYYISCYYRECIHQLFLHVMMDKPWAKTIQWREVFADCRSRSIQWVIKLFQWHIFCFWHNSLGKLLSRKVGTYALFSMLFWVLVVYIRLGLYSLTSLYSSHANRYKYTIYRTKPS